MLISLPLFNEITYIDDFFEGNKKNKKQINESIV